MIGKFFDFMDERHIVRRLLLILVAYMSYDTYQWAKELVMVKDTPGAELGLIIAAVTVPISFLLKELVSLYNQSREGSKG